MRYTTNDKTLTRNYIKRFKFLIREYEQVKKKQHPRFKFVSDFYRFHNTNRQTFLKYYNRFHTSGDETDLLPQKRGPKWKSRCPLPYIENKVCSLRKQGLNRYEIAHILKPQLKQHTPSPSGVYTICKRYGLHRLTKAMKQHKRTIIKQHAGDMGHIDCHYLAQDCIAGMQRQYLIGLIDDATRIAWVEIIPDYKALTTMFATIRLLHYFMTTHQIQFTEILSDNGSEFGNKQLTKPAEHPFERLLIEMDITHRYTRPYRPQTNGKIERFWRTLEDDLLGDMVFDSLEQLQDELSQYLYYYNHIRPHQGIDGDTPILRLKNLSTN